MSLFRSGIFFRLLNTPVYFTEAEFTNLRRAFSVLETVSVLKKPRACACVCLP